MNSKVILCTLFLSLFPVSSDTIGQITKENCQLVRNRQISLKEIISGYHTITSEDIWYGFHRIKFDFDGYEAWVVEPESVPAEGVPWTWTVQWSEAFVDRTGVPDLLGKGYHHATIDVFRDRGNDHGIAVMARYKKFLTDTLGFSPEANLIGMSWGGFFSVRYAAAHPEDVCKIYLDAPLLVFDSSSGIDIGPWSDSTPADNCWHNDPRMPVNMAGDIAGAHIPVLLLYGGQDRTVPPETNCELFAERLKAAGGDIEINRRDLFGHHPHGLDPNKTAQICRFFTE